MSDLCHTIHRNGINAQELHLSVDAIPCLLGRELSKH